MLRSDSKLRLRTKLFFPFLFLCCYLSYFYTFILPDIPVLQQVQVIPLDLISNEIALEQAQAQDDHDRISSISSKAKSEEVKANLEESHAGDGEQPKETLSIVPQDNHVSTPLLDLSIPVKLLNKDRQESKTDADPSTSTSTTSTITTARTKKCALLFFGLVQEFEDYVYPSIEENILTPNPQCDVYLHTYNITSIPVNKRSQETGIQKPLNVSEALVLTTPDRIVFEDMDSFHEKRDEFITRTRKNHHKKWGKCCTSHDNMIKQWNSIHGVWDLMRQHEVRLLQGNENEKYYDQIGLFRSDAIYTEPIHIYDDDAISPSFGQYNGYNDRLFYGKYKYAKIWASKRFHFATTFEETYMEHESVRKGKGKKRKQQGYHSESYLKHLMDHYRVPMKTKDICVWRVRSGPRIRIEDCIQMENFSHVSDIMWYVPEGLSIFAS